MPQPSHFYLEQFLVICKGSWILSLLCKQLQHPSKNQTLAVGFLQGCPFPPPEGRGSTGHFPLNTTAQGAAAVCEQGLHVGRSPGAKAFLCVHQDQTVSPLELEIAVTTVTAAGKEDFRITAGELPAPTQVMQGPRQHCIFGIKLAGDPCCSHKCFNMSKRQGLHPAIQH